jgi:hypothetical protein
MARRKVNHRNLARSADTGNRYALRERPTRHSTDQFSLVEHPAPLSRKVPARNALKPGRTAELQSVTFYWI